MTSYLVPRILLYIHAALSILPNQSPQKELLSEDELIACFSRQNGWKKIEMRMQIQATLLTREGKGETA